MNISVKTLTSSEYLQYLSKCFENVEKEKGLSYLYIKLHAVLMTYKARDTWFCGNYFTAIVSNTHVQRLGCFVLMHLTK